MSDYTNLPLTNIFNTAGVGGARPLSEDDIWAKLISHVVFMGGAIIPCTNVLCNPATYKWLKNERKRRLIEWLVGKKRLSILRYTEDESFESFAESLIEKESSALKWTSTKTIRELAKVLDSIFKRSGMIETVDLSPVDDAKTRISWTFIDDIGRVHPGLSAFKTELVEEARKKFDKAGVLHGTWWANLGEQNTTFSRFRSDLQRVGGMVYDFAHAIRSTQFLIGHPYDQTLLQVSRVTEPFVTKYVADIEPKIIRSSEVKAAIFHRAVLDNMGIGFLSFLEEGTETGHIRSKYFQALDDLYIDATEDRLKEVHARFDDYVNALGDLVEREHLKEYFEKLSSLNWMKSTVRAWKCIDSVVCSLWCSSLAGASGFGVKFLSEGKILEFFITLLACGAMGGVARVAKSQKKKLVATLSQQDMTVRASRPHPLVLGTSMSDPQ